jgi:ABC-2 type transport system permease protein
MTGLAGTGGLIRLILRRDRVILPLWLIAVAGIVLQWVGTVGTVYGTPASRHALFDQVRGTPMYLLFQGQMFDASLGSVFAQRPIPQGAVLAALGAALIVVRHTRSEEQAGRRELLGSTVIGRPAPLTAVLVVMFCSGLLLGTVCAVVLVGAGLPVAGSLCAGLVIGSGVWVTAVNTALLAQLTQNARVAAIGGYAIFWAFHLLRGIGAMGGESTAWLGWVIPNGWLENARPYAGERWWVFALIALWLLVLGGIAYAISARRDLGAGVRPVRLGPARAGSSLRGPVGLAWRLHRTMLIVWVVVAIAFGMIMGFIGAGAMEAYAQSRWVIDFARMINSDNTADALFVYIIGVMAIVVGMYGVMAALRLRSEESGGGAETVLTEPVSRRRWMAAHLGFAIGAPVVILSALGLGLGLGSGINTGGLGQIGHMLSLTIPYSPAVWVITGITAAAFGLLPRGTAVIGWAGLAVGVAAELAVKAYVLPDWVFRALSPFSHASPAYSPTTVDYIMLTLIAGALIAVGIAAFSRRDLAV